MKAEIPESLKADVPQTTWGKILTATPVVMAVVSTMLAGLASSEMTRAQYSRSLAAQLQSKAGDQWSFFQAKRLRASVQRNTLDLLQASQTVHDPDLLRSADLANVPAALTAMQKGVLPPLPPAPELDRDLKAVLTALTQERPESEIAPVLAKVSPRTLDKALGAARERMLAYDATLEPINQAIEHAEQSLGEAEAGTAKREFIAARLRYTGKRYDAEARLNQAIASLYELQVRQSNAEAERHHRRSARFFYGMLAAQTAVIVSTFSLAARKRSFLWTLAAAAGLAAVAFAIYVYLWV